MLSNELYYILISNKNTVYYDKIPDSIYIADKTRTESMIEYLNNNDINNVFLIKDELIDGRTIADTYYHLDTHWNNFGAFIGVNAIMKKIDSNFDLFDNFDVKEEKLNYKKGDLYRMMGFECELCDKFLNVDNNFLTDYMEVDYENNLKISKNDNYQYDKRIMIVGDSFTVATKKYFSSLYKEVVYIHRGGFNGDLVEKYSPEIVIILGVERYSAEIFDLVF